MKLTDFPDVVALDEKNSFYKKLLFHIPDFVFQMKISPCGTYSFPFISKSAFSHFGLSSHEIEDDAINVLTNKVDPDDRAAFFSSLEHCRSKLVSWSHEFRVRLPQGRRWMRGFASVEAGAEGEVNFYGRIVDITEDKTQENVRRLSEERYQFALEASTKGVWDLDLVTDKVFYSSQSMKMLQFGDSDIIDSHAIWDDRIHPDDKEDYLQEMQLHLRGETPYYQNAKRMFAMDGTCKWILSRGKVIERAPDGRPLRLIGTHTDITKEKEREQQLRKTMEIISEQNSRLLNFAHIVSHNLRSHSGNLSTLLQIMESDEESLGGNDTFKHLLSTSDALSDTIEHLKELVNIHTALEHKSENLNLNEYLTKVLVILREDITANSVTINNFIPDSAAVAFNPAYLESILLNFTTNAIKYSSPERTPVITYTFSQSDAGKVLEIKDNGLGINLEKYGSRLFGMYKTFHDNPAARGIGLFITKNQIESMGGSIAIESEEGKGTVFKIYFND